MPDDHHDAMTQLLHELGALGRREAMRCERAPREAARAGR